MQNRGVIPRNNGQAPPPQPQMVLEDLLANNSNSNSNSNSTSIHTYLCVLLVNQNNSSNNNHNNNRNRTEDIILMVHNILARILMAKLGIIRVG